MPMILSEAGVPDGGELPPGVSETVPPNGQIIMFLAPNENRSVCACVCVWPHDDMNDHSADAHIDQD